MEMNGVLLLAYTLVGLTLHLLCCRFIFHPPLLWISAQTTPSLSHITEVLLFKSAPTQIDVVDRQGLQLEQLRWLGTFITR